MLNSPFTMAAQIRNLRYHRQPMQPTDFWRDKTVIITGGSSGIGLALAEALAPRGARLGLIARRPEQLNDATARFTARGAIAQGCPADVRDADSIQNALLELERGLGPCDILIAGAGIQRNTRGEQFDTAEAADVVQTNLLGVIHTIGPILPGMVARSRGRIVVISSIASLLGLPRISVYCATKAALRTLMDGLGVDLHRTGVKLTTICPGFVDTPLISAHNPGITKSKLTPQYAALRIIAAIEAGQREVWFPWRMRLFATAATLLPYGVYRRLCGFLPSRSRDAARQRAASNDHAV